MACKWDPGNDRDQTNLASQVTLHGMAIGDLKKKLITFGLWSARG